MQRLVFTIQRETLHFIIKGKEIWYTDRYWKNYIRCLPRNEQLIKQIIMSRNKIPSFLSQLFNFSDKDIAEYDAAKDEEELAQLIIRDAKSKYCHLSFSSKEDTK